MVRKCETKAEGKEEAVVVGVDGGGVVESTDSNGSNAHSGHGQSGSGSEAPDSHLHTLSDSPTVHTAATVTFFIQRQTGMARACATTERVQAAAVLLSALSAGVRSTTACHASVRSASRWHPRLVWRLMMRTVKPPYSVHPVQQRHSNRPSSQPQSFAVEQAEQHALEAANRQINRMEAAAPQPAAAALPPPVTQLATVAAIVSHGPLHSVIPFADHTAWIERCTPALEHYRQASTTNDTVWMTAALVELL